MITFKQKGDFSNLTRFLEKSKKIINKSLLDKYGLAGVAALSSATPVDTGLASKSWNYSVTITKEFASISFYNNDIEDGAPVVIVLQYGHATKNGGWVDGIDFINPVVQPIFKKIADEAWEEVKRV